MCRKQVVRNPWVLLVIGVLCLSLRFPPPLTLTFLDVGQGDGIVIRQGSVTLLIDGGSTSASGVGTYRLRPFLEHEGIGYLDAVLISHEDEDHISGVLELMEDMRGGGICIGCLVLPEIAGGERTDNYLRLETEAARTGIPVRYLGAGDTFTAGELFMTCLSPARGGAAQRSDSANAHSMVLHLRYGSFTALFTGDVEEEGLSELNAHLATLPPAMRTLSVLKVAHHGSRLTTDEAFLSLVDADLSVISCGKNNRYGHPHVELLERLAADGTRIITTADCGAITVRVSKDGATCTVIPYRPQD